MPVLTNILAFFGLLCATTTAVPINMSTSTDATCHQAFDAKFDHLNISSPPPSGFAGAAWENFIVVSPDRSIFIPESGANVVKATNAETSSIEIGSAVGEISSFYFTCTSQTPLDGSITISVNCSIMVTSIAYAGYKYIQSSGPFIARGADTPGTTPKMTRVDLNVAASEFYFQVVDGPATTTLYLDNVAVIQPGAYCG